MDFNFENVFEDMTKAFTDNLSGKGDQLISSGKDALEKSKDKFESLSALLLSGSIDKDEYNVELKDIKMTLENSMLVDEVILKASLQNAINSAIDVLNTAIFKFLKPPI